MRLQHIAQRGCHSATCSSPPYAFAHAMARYRLRAHAPHGYRISLSYGSAHPTVAQNGPRWRHHAVQVTPFVGRPNDTKGWGEGAAEGAGDDDVDDEGDEDDDSDDDDGGTSRCRRAHRVKSVSKSESSRVLAPARDSTGGSRPGWPHCGKWHCKQEKESKEERQEEADDSAKDQRVPATHPQVWPPTSAPGLGSPLRPIRSRKCHRYRRRGWDVVQPAGSHGARYSGCAGCEYPGGTQAAQGVGAFKGLRLRRVWVPRRDSGCAGCGYQEGTQAAQGVGAFKGLRLRRVWVPSRDSGCAGCGCLQGTQAAQGVGTQEVHAQVQPGSKPEAIRRAKPG
jgi:hypothetical protein